MKNQGKAMEVYNEVKFMEEFKAGDVVKFAPGHRLAGVVGTVGAINPDGTIGVMAGGKALQEPTDQAMLIKVEIDNGKVPAPEAPTNMPATAAATP